MTGVYSNLAERSPTMETVLPEDVGFSADRLARVGELSRRYVDGGKLAGLVTMLARGGKTFP